MRVCVCCMLSRSAVSDSCEPMDCSSPGSSAHGDSPDKNPGMGWLPCLASGDLPKPGIESMSPALQTDSLPAKPPGKPLEWVAYPFIRGSS